MAGQEPGLFWGEEGGMAMAPELTPLEKELRDLFVKEYLFDRDKIAAAIRCGFNPGYAKQYAEQFWLEPYTQKRLKEMQLDQFAEKEQAEQDKRAVMISLREALQVGPYASRVAAAGRLSAILGMDAPTKSEQTVLHRGGVMATPPIATPDAWEKAAQDSQDKLVSETRH